MQSGHWGAWPEVIQEFRGRQQLGPTLFTARWVLFNISKEEIEVTKSSETSSSFFSIPFFLIFFKIAERLWPCQWELLLSPMLGQCVVMHAILYPPPHQKKGFRLLVPLFSSFPGHERASHSLTPPPAARTRLDRTFD